MGGCIDVQNDECERMGVMSFDNNKTPSWMTQLVEIENEKNNKVLV